MAEAMCGPSNPLQQFKQQTSIDRTLQQDRLTSRHSPAQGFRSPNLHAGLLDPEFEAFQAGVDPGLLTHGQPFQHSPAFSGSPQAPSWASDFQNLQISSPPSMLQQPRPWQSGAGASDWAQGFREHVAQSAPRAQSSSPSPQAFQQRARYGLTGFQSTLNQSSFVQPGYALEVQSKGKEPAFEQFDEAAFERAFDSAKEDMLDLSNPVTAESIIQQAVGLTQDVRTGERERNMDESDFDWRPEQAIHGPDIEHVVEAAPLAQEQRTDSPQQEDDALAATAQELLEKIEHNHSDKFKNSQFLGLMRRLRDREVRVEGDKMVETANASSSATVESDTLNATSTSRVQTTPYVNGQSIPVHEQDHDVGRVQQPSDGQDVVNLLNQPGYTEDIGMSSHLPEGASFEDDDESGDVFHPASTSLPEMLYRAGGPLEGFDSPS